MNQISRESFFRWVNYQHEFVIEVEPDKSSPDWLCTINDPDESFVFSIEHETLEDYLVITIAKLPEATEIDDTVFIEMLRACNQVNGNHLGATCKVDREFVGVLFFTAIPFRLFASISDDNKTLYAKESFAVLKSMIQDYLRQFPFSFWQ